MKYIIEDFVSEKTARSMHRRLTNIANTIYENATEDERKRDNLRYLELDSDEFEEDFVDGWEEFTEEEGVELSNIQAAALHAAVQAGKVAAPIIEKAIVLLIPVIATQARKEKEKCQTSGSSVTPT